MFKVIDVLKLGDRLSVTVSGNGQGIRNGTKLTDRKGLTVTVESVAMTRPEETRRIGESTTVLVPACDIKPGSELYTA